MPSPLFLAAASFFTVIVVGSLLVALNDWLAGRHADPPLSIATGPRRVSGPLAVHQRRRTVRPALRLDGQEKRTSQRELVADWF